MHLFRGLMLKFSIFGDLQLRILMLLVVSVDWLNSASVINDVDISPQTNVHISKYQFVL